MKKYFCVRCVLTQKDYEIALGRWYALGMEGCEETGRSDGSLEIRAYFSNAEAATKAVSELQENDGCVAAVNLSSVPEEDWNARWRASMQPVLVAPSLWVSPPWLPPAHAEKDKWIKIEPKAAFGTGHHETTRLACRMLIDCILMRQSGVSVLDIGTGSGVLCFAAAINGAKRCIGLEIDRECRENIAENSHLNRFDNVSFVIGTVDAIGAEAAFEAVAMNLLFNEAAPLLDSCQRLTKERGILVWSGILLEEKRSAVEAAAASTFTLVKEIAENEWWCGMFEKNGNK